MLKDTLAMGEIKRFVFLSGY